MKKLLAIVFVIAIIASLAACSGSSAATPTPSAAPSASPSPSAAPIVLKVAASSTPHAEILAQVKDDLAAQGIDLQVTEYGDYVIPNTAVEDGLEDVNYFQHQPYLDEFNKENGTHLVSVAAIHYEPFGIYPGKCKDLKDLKDGAVIGVPSDVTNEARALMLLEAQGYIKLKDGAGLTATPNDIVENPKKLTFMEVEAAMLPRITTEVDLAVINGNYALQAGFSSAKDALALEDASSEAAQTFANIIVVKEGNEKNPAVLALVAALKTDKIRDYINNTYEGNVLPIF